MVRHYCDRCGCDIGKLPFAKMFIDITLNLAKSTVSEQAKEKEYCQTCYNKIMALIEGDE